MLINDTSDAAREKYREHIRKKYRSPERRFASHGVCGPPYEKYEQLIIANGDRRETEILHRPWRHYGAMSEQMVAVPTEALFEADSDGPQTVVLLGGAGTGKTTLARKILLDWASGRLFPGRFDYLFYLSCGQLNLVQGQVDLADLILNSDPELREREEIMELLEIPVKLLFIIDGFHELTCSIEHQEDHPSVDPREKKPVGALLSALFHRALLPEACLLITTRPSALESLRNCLQSERCVRLLGFSEEGKEEYFLKVFGDKKLATQALSYVKGDEALFALSFVPNLCWVLCTVLKQQLDRGKEDLVPLSEKLTAVYALYLSRLTESPCSSSGQWNLRGLCSLAADGIRKNKTLFKAEEIQKHSSGHLGSLPPALFQKDPDSEGLYRFLHLSAQEFLAALFYVLEDTAKDPETMKQDLELSLERCGKDPGDMALFAQFIFSLLNREIMEYLKEQFGWQISPAVKADLLDWFKTDTQVKSDCPNYHPLERFHYFYAIQEEEFVQCALDHLTEITMDRLTFTPLDQAVLSFCVQNCLHLEALCLYGSLFLSKEPKGEELPGHLSHPCQPDQKTQKRSAIYLLCQALKDPNNRIRKLELDGCQLTDGCWADLSTVLSTSQRLVELDLQAASLKESGARLLCEGLSHPSCMLEKLGLKDCGLTSVSGRDLSTVFGTSQKLRELELGWNPLLGDQGVQLLCEGLKHPNCKLQSLGLSSCNLSAASCQDLIPVLSTSQTLLKLNLEDNKVGDAGVKMLSEGLKHPNCVLQTLLLETSELSPACCGDFSSILSTSQTLTELALEYNGLGDAGVRLLCEGLKQPSCKLQKLRLARCNITAASCGDLSSALEARQTLTELVVECNELRDPGVKLLCRGLKHPHCKLQLLNLYNCDLTAACCADLASVLNSNQTLTELLLGGNQLGDSGVQLLCEGLKHPKCTLQKLCLCGTEITAAGWGEICSALSTNQMLEDIDLWNNPLGDSGMRLLCEALKHPGCKLQILSLWNCQFTSASCRDLCSALSTNQSLKKLKLGGNNLGDSGVKMLCEGLKDPSCGLEAIELDIDELSEDTVRELSSVKRIKPDLVIDT
ncbi:NACHT, LRR and PYD domains-containing protein 12-like [Lacerta agilis]|uniref:NACHT, LRR and PYD domains-containing protein 12-like n=1 Tax=Lacerta agilis TaxID=80427 RepID=UPI001419873E|nr:NACHT, LRR and PYD domains-containing protein 12-like [Lacerta agilis]